MTSDASKNDGGPLPTWPASRNPAVATPGHTWTGRLARTALAAFLAAAAGLVSAQESAGRYQAPSGSMKPTIQPGSVLPAFKYAGGASPARGDIVAFRPVSDPGTTFIMRVVGLPGERIQMVGGRLQINGQAVKREKMPDVADTEDGKTVQVRCWRETLPNGVSYETLDLVDHFFLDDTGLFTIPAGSLFVLGDNRDNAVDSRLPEVGFVPIENVVGYFKLAADRAAR
jgi:signal peptidase I